MKNPLGARGPRVNARVLYVLRVEAGLTQTDLARLAGVDQPAVSRLESAQTKFPAPRVTVAIARALGVPVATLLADEFAGVNPRTSPVVDGDRAT